jgi:hypothetical protein
MFVIDTNILIYAANRDFEEHRRAKTLLEGWRKNKESWYITYGIMYEFLRIVTHPRIFSTPWDITKAWNFIDILLDNPAGHILTETDKHLETAAETGEKVPFITGNLLFDFHTAVIMKENGIRTIFTRDTDFLKFRFLEVIDPFISA